MKENRKKLQGVEPRCLKRNYLHELNWLFFEFEMCFAQFCNISLIGTTSPAQERENSSKHTTPAKFVSPWLCSHAKSYSAKNSCHWDCGCDNFFYVWKKVLATLSVFTINLGPNRYTRHTPRQWTTVIISFLCVEYRCFASLSVRLSNATWCPSYEWYCC